MIPSFVWMSAEGFSVYCFRCFSNLFKIRMGNKWIIIIVGIAVVVTFIENVWAWERARKWFENVCLCLLGWMLISLGMIQSLSALLNICNETSPGPFFFLSVSLLLRHNGGQWQRWLEHLETPSLLRIDTLQPVCKAFVSSVQLKWVKVVN